MEGANKYWLEESHWGCTFCKEGRDSVEHQVKECQIIRERLKELGEDEGRIIKRIWEENLDEAKRGFKKWWKEKEKELNKKRVERRRKKRIERWDQEQETKGIRKKESGKEIDKRL